MCEDDNGNADGDAPLGSLSRATVTAHGGAFVTAPGGDVVPPLRPSTTFTRGPDGELAGAAEYQRDDTPTGVPAETLLAALEGGAAALLFASGMAAATAVLHALRPGDHIVAQRVMYWGLRGWLEDFCARWGVALDLVESRTEAVGAAVRPGETRLVWIETPSNPTWDVMDIDACARLAHSGGATLVVDSTVATPVHTSPLAYGADIVLHSATKALNGHSDLVAGALVAADTQVGPWPDIRAARKEGGAILGAFEAWLLLRGMRTLFPRVRCASANAQRIAERMAGHSRVDAVLYPGLPDHPGHEIAARQMQGGFGSMLSLRIAGGRDAALAMVSACRLFRRATSLGGVESLIEHRASIEGPDSPVPDDLVRISVGIEDADDLVADLEHALKFA